MMPMGRVEWIFVHTAAFSGDCGAAEIDEWHRARGWAGIGYHYVIRRSGEVEAGRSIRYAGAHVAGCNSRSIGICCEGHGDYEPHTPEQRSTLLHLCRSLMADYGLAPERVLGHREVNGLIDAGHVGDHYRTAKSCPGDLVDMDEIRQWLGPLGEVPGTVISDSMGLFGWLMRRRTPTMS
jgi:N-acetylmuramoyl-L-alanine amidase